LFQEHGGKKHEIGDPGSVVYSEWKKAVYFDNPLSKACIAAGTKIYNHSEHDKITKKEKDSRPP
jgi:hypothetical protein